MKIANIIEGEHAEIYDTGDFSPDNIDVWVKGVGRYSLSSLKQRLKQRLSFFAELIDTNPAGVERMLSGKGMDAFMSMLQGYVEVLADLDSPQMKRKRTLALKKAQYSNESVIAALRHINEGVPFTESLFRYGSDAYFETINIGRSLYRAGLIESLDEDTLDIFESELGQKVRLKGLGEVYLDAPFMEEDLDEAEYQGKEVELNKPKRGGSKKYYVYTKNPKTGKVKKISFGDPGLKTKSGNKDRARNFAARHNCEKKNDRTKAGYWACRLPRYGLVKGGKWW